MRACQLVSLAVSVSSSLRGAWLYGVPLCTPRSRPAVVPRRMFAKLPLSIVVDSKQTYFT